MVNLDNSFFNVSICVFVLVKTQCFVNTFEKSDELNLLKLGRRFAIQLASNQSLYQKRSYVLIIVFLVTHFYQILNYFKGVNK